MTPWVRALLFANVIMYFVTQASPAIGNALVFYPPLVIQRPWTLLTYMFLHANLGHIFFNMLGLLFFGPRLEGRLGGNKFLLLWLLAGLGGALLQLAFVREGAMVGASAGVYGVLMGFAYFWPRQQMIIFPIPVPMEARIVIAGYLLLSFAQGISPISNGVAHFAHLGGAIAAFVYLKWSEWRSGAAKREFQQKMRPETAARGLMGDRVALARWKGISVESLHELNRGEVERLIAKAERGGPASLTQSERDFLDRMSVK